MKLTIELSDEEADQLFELAERANQRIDAVAYEILRPALVPRKPSRLEVIRGREEEVKRLHALGYGDGEIADRMGISLNGARQIRLRLELPAVGRRGPVANHTREAS